MRCICCNKMLNEYESVRRLPDSNEFADMCNHCFSFIGVSTQEYIDTPDDTGADTPEPTLNTITKNDMFDYNEWN